MAVKVLWDLCWRRRGRVLQMTSEIMMVDYGQDKPQ